MIQIHDMKQGIIDLESLFEDTSHSFSSTLLHQKYQSILTHSYSIQFSYPKL
jgi:hypothetical protein